MFVRFGLDVESNFVVVWLKIGLEIIYEKYIQRVCLIESDCENLFGVELV